MLTWRGPRPTAGVEAAAREARYRLLVRAAVRGRRDAPGDGAPPRRPGRDVPDAARAGRGRLRARSDARGGRGGTGHAGPAVPRRGARAPGRDHGRAGLIPVDDPMNTDLRFQRSRVRRAMPLLGVGGLDAERLAGIARRMGDGRCGDRRSGDRAARIGGDDRCAWRRLAGRGCVCVSAVAMCACARSPGCCWPSAARTTRRASSAWRAWPRRSGPSRRAAVQADAGRRGRGSPPRATSCSTASWGATGLPTLALRAGFGGTWDNRFQVAVAR